jgi:peptidoglycan/LPS O-acetylase OafA/YrhL
LKNKVDKLNLLRLIAFSLIFFLHAKIFIPDWYTHGMPCAFLVNTPAWAGSWIFFILSGYGVGIGFFSGKYELSFDGISSFYMKRLSSILPLYWFWIIFISVFVKPEILIPSVEHFIYLLKLLFFNYQEDFFHIEYGVAWYLTTLIRLYLVAPLGAYLIRSLVKSRKAFWVTLILLTGIMMALRLGMLYYYNTPDEATWSRYIYKPFYFNFDLFFGGMILSHIKCQRHSKSLPLIFKPIVVGSLLVLIVYNSFIHYYSKYFEYNLMWIYQYILPTVYLLVVLAWIYLFDVSKSYVQTQLSWDQIKRNPVRIIDCFNRIQYPIYLFHASILFYMRSAFTDDICRMVCSFFISDPDVCIWAGDIFFTLSALIISILWALLIWTLFKNLDISFIHITDNAFIDKIKNAIIKSEKK